MSHHSHRTLIATVLFIVFVASLSLVPAVPAAAVPQVAEPELAHPFMVHTLPNNGGRMCYSNNPEIANISAWCDDPANPDYQISSIELEVGWSVRVYDGANQTGTSVCISRSQANLSINTFEDNTNVDNRISSFQLFNQPYCGTGGLPAFPLEVYNESGYPAWQWPCFSFKEETANINSGCNDQISSILLRAGWFLRVYEGPNQTGATACLAGSDPNLSDNYYDGTQTSLNDTISSFVLSTNNLCQGPPANIPPNAPILQSPANGATLGSRSMTLSWQDGGDPDNGPRPSRDFYAFIRNAANTWSQTLTWQFGTSWNVTVPADGTYVWNVQAGDGAIGTWAGERTVVVGTTIQPLYPFMVYDTPNFNGNAPNPNPVAQNPAWCFSTKAETANIAPSCGDKTSSISLAPGWSVRVYRDQYQQGPSACLTASDLDLSNNTYDGGQPMNNTISSFVLYQQPTCQSEHPFIVYENPNYNQGFPKLAVCWSDRPETFNINPGCAGKISSVRIRSGWSVRVYAEPNQRGFSACLVGDDSDLSNNYFDSGTAMNDQIRSFALYNQPTCPAPVVVIEPDHAVVMYSDPQNNNVCNVADTAGETSQIAKACEDRISAIHLKSGWSVRVFEHGNFQGASACFMEDESDLNHSFYANGNPINDSISSFVLYGRPMCNPLIFIPGIMGSELREKGGGYIWPVFIGDDNKLRLPEDKVFATDAVRKFDIIGDIVSFPFYINILDHIISIGYQEWNTSISQQSPINLCQNARNRNIYPTLFVFAYDWRQDNAESAKQLAQLVNCIRLMYRGGEVDILTHSMGGLVARRYLIDHQNDHHVDKLITIAAPWLGTPKTLVTAISGWDSPEIAALVDSAYMKILTRSFSSVLQLMPSRGYYQLGQRPVVEGGRDLDGDWNPFYWNEEFSYDQYISLMDTGKIFSPFLSQPGSIIDRFHSVEQDNWKGKGYDVRYFHIYGKRKTRDTISKIKSVYKPQCIVFGVVGGMLCQKLLEYDVDIDYGDGTVTIPSASREGGGQNLNADKYKSIEITNGETEHIKLTQNSEVLRYIKEILKSNPSTSPYLPSSPAEAEADETLPAYYLTLYGAEALLIADEDGNTTHTLSGTLSSPVSTVAYNYLGNAAHSTVLPTVRTYTVTFEVGNEPLFIEITHGDSITADQAIRYRDLSLPISVTAMLIFTPQGVEQLRYDANGDGSFETLVTPTVDLSGAPANDLEAPQVAITSVGSLTASTVTITATDTGAGIDSIWYSLDGRQFTQYTAPFQINPLQTPQVYVFADDLAANRSSLQTYTLVRSTYLPGIIRPQ